MKKDLIIISTDSSEKLKENLKAYGHVISLSHSTLLDKREAAHPDMRICRVSEAECVIAPDVPIDIVSVLQKYGVTVYKGNTNLSERYPENIAYNVLVGDKIFFHNINYTDSILLSQLSHLKKEAVCVKQGYCGCSSIFAGNVLITSDYGIYKKATNFNFETILFENPGMIFLDGFDHGFIGGCCGYNNATGLLINCSDDFLPFEFKKKLEDYNVKYNCVGEGRLTDIGGIIIFTGQC